MDPDLGSVNNIPPHELIVFLPTDFLNERPGFVRWNTRVFDPNRFSINVFKPTFYSFIVATVVYGS
jgi:hypothetical protein